MKLPLVSLVMPTFNSAQFIRETLHSLIDQTYSNFELIVVDGGSTDDTLKIVESYLGDDDLKVIALSREEGTIPKSLNRGISEAKGEFIARMDADDVALPTRLAEQVHFLTCHSEIDLAGSGTELFWGGSGICRNPQWHDDIEDNYLINNPFFHPTVMFRRELYDRGLYYYREDQLCDEDYELWGRLIPKATCANIDQTLLRYRIHNQNSQWDPRKHAAKTYAITEFCQAYGIDNLPLIDTLVELQCSGFLRYEGYRILVDYVREAESKKLPKLGWVHDALLLQEDYPSFQAWYRRTRGWPV